jgi:hypothetical protein
LEEKVMEKIQGSEMEVKFEETGKKQEGKAKA